MLPRLRFVFAAALIAALPWIVLGSGPITTAQNTPVAEMVRAGTAVAVSVGDLRDSHHMHALAYVRRSRELERLRELASSPLSEWVVAPAGITTSDHLDLIPTDTPGEIEAAPAPVAAPQVQLEPASEPIVVANLPSEPMTNIEAPAAATPEETAPEIALVPPIAPTRSEEPQAQANEDVEPNVANVDWSKIAPPLPRARFGEDRNIAPVDWSTVAPPLPRARAVVEHRNVTNRRTRLKRAHLSQAAQDVAPNPFATVQPNLFGAPPATATIQYQWRHAGITQ